LTLLHISEDMTRATFGLWLGEDKESIRQDMEGQSWNVLNEMRDRYFPNDLVDTVVVRGEESPYFEIIAYAKSHHADLIVIASHGENYPTGTTLGSIAQRVIRSARCPVLVVPVDSERAQQRA
jgi:nucleotide-binding universal stress UspA family protein